MCTNIKFSTDDSSILVARNMDHTFDLESRIAVRLQGSKFYFKPPVEFSQHYGQVLEWNCTYSYTGLTFTDYPLLVDGINSQGLSIGGLWLVGTQYQPYPPPDGVFNIPCYAFIDWVLGKCASVEDVRNAIETGSIAITGTSALEQIDTLHFPVHDARGNSIVIEFINGQAVITEDPVGILTNLPTFPWHLTNLTNYAGLSPVNATSTALGRLSLVAPGSGTGAIGMPGSGSPPSRFVRAAFFTQWALKGATAVEGTATGFNLLNTVAVVKGTEIVQPASDGTEAVYDYTQWSVVKNLTAPSLTVRTCDSPLAWGATLGELEAAVDPILGMLFVDIPKKPLSLPFILP